MNLRAGVFIFSSVIVSLLSGVAMAQSVTQTIEKSPCSTIVSDSNDSEVRVGDCTIINNTTIHNAPEGNAPEGSFIDIPEVPSDIPDSSAISQTFCNDPDLSNESKYRMGCIGF